MLASHEILGPPTATMYSCRQRLQRQAHSLGESTSKTKSPGGLIRVFSSLRGDILAPSLLRGGNSRHLPETGSNQ